MLKYQGKIAGFAIVDKLKHLDGKEGFEIGEFFILKKYTGLGLGRKFAFYLFDSFKGNWQVRQKEGNNSAIKFWRKIISEYTSNNFTKEFVDNDEWSGPVQYFSNY